jgi:hypothetical protein
LRAGSGPAIEFLEYLAPRDGRQHPLDSHANDLWHWQTKLISTNRPALIRDRDGHAMMLVEP